MLCIYNYILYIVGLSNHLEKFKNKNQTPIKQYSFDSPSPSLAHSL